MVVDVIGEGGYRRSRAAFGDKHGLARIDVDEQRNVVVAAFCRGLVDANTVDLGEIHVRDGLLNIVPDNAPDARVVFIEQVGCGPHGHVCDQRHGERFEQQREA